MPISNPSTVDVPITLVEKTMDQTLNNSAVYVDDDALVLPVKATERWSIFFLLRESQAASAGNPRCQFTVPAGAVFLWHASGDIAILATAVTGLTDRAAGGDFICTDLGAAGTRAYYIWGVYLGAAAAGILKFRWRQNSANASDTKVLAGSHIVARRIST